MELKITEEKEDILLSRKEIKADITFKGATPSKEDIKKQLSSVMKSDDKLIAVKNVFTSFGSETAKVIAYQYTSEEEMKRIEPKEKEKKEKPKEEKKEAAKEEVKEEKKEAPKEEKPKKEEKKEEAKKEEKQKEQPTKQEKK